MTAKIAISSVSIDAQIECEDAALAERLQAIIEASQERLEHAMTQAVKAEFKKMFPTLTVKLTGIIDEEGD